MSSAATSTKPYSVHLLVTAHGLWGNPSHIAYITESARKFAEKAKKRGTDSGSKLVVLAAKGNGVTWTHTYDGVDVCADRVVEEIDEQIAQIEKDGGKVDKFSMVGYSLGGLVARYVIGLLDSRTPSFFDKVEPVNFATFASPWIGIPHYQTFWSTVFRFLGARFLSRTGSQLYERDDFLPSRFIAPSPPMDTPRKGINKLFGAKRDKPQAEGLLKIMADPRYSFYRALSKFERINVFANTMNDRTVPFITGAFEAHDPFALARAKAQKIAEDRWDDPQKELNIKEGGLEVTLRPDAPIVASVKQVPPPPTSALQPARPPTTMQRFRRHLPKVPGLLRPSTYPVSRPKAWVVIISLPISLPVFFAYLVVRFSLQGHQSRRRIKEARKKRGNEGREGSLARVGFRIAEAVAEQVGVDNPEYAARLTEPKGREEGEFRSAATSAATSGTATPADFGVNGGKGESTPHNAAKLADQKTYGSSSSVSATSTSSASSSTPLTSSPSSSSSSTPSGSPRSFLPLPPPSDLALAQQLKTDPIFTPAQQFMLDSLNALPQLTKAFVYQPHIRHTHGAIVRRDPRFYYAKEGIKVVDSWAREARW
ncbi:hypothetical protein JCM8097_007772 [Rhodosporidiobolus ruineniae]